MDYGNTKVVIDDLLSFVYHKKDSIPQSVLISTLENFYSEATGHQSMKNLLSSLTRKRRYLKLLTKFEEPNVFKAILLFLGLVEERDLPTFLCQDLGNIPSICKNASALYENKILNEHQVLKCQINEFYAMVHQLKNNLANNVTFDQLVSKSCFPNDLAESIVSTDEKLDRVKLFKTIEKEINKIIKKVKHFENVTLSFERNVNKRSSDVSFGIEAKECSNSKKYRTFDKNYYGQGTKRRKTISPIKIEPSFNMVICMPTF